MISVYYHLQNLGKSTVFRRFCATKRSSTFLTVYLSILTVRIKPRMFCTTRLPVARYVLRFTRRALRFTRHVCRLSFVCAFLYVTCCAFVVRRWWVVTLSLLVIALWSCILLCGRVCRCASLVVHCRCLSAVTKYNFEQNRQ